MLELKRKRLPRSEWPDGLGGDLDRIEALQAGWWKQLMKLSKPELRVLANAALMWLEAFETENRLLRSELAERDRLRTERGNAARSPAVENFKATVKKEWERVRVQGKGRTPRGFATNMVGLKGAAVSDPRTVLRWCREWEAEMRRAANPPLRLPHGTSVGADVFARVGLLRQMVVQGRDREPTF